MAEATFFVSADTFTVILTSCNRHLATIAPRVTFAPITHIATIAPRVTFAPITFLVTSTLVVTLALRLAVMERFDCSYCCGLLISDVCDQKPIFVWTFVKHSEFHGKEF